MEHNSNRDELNPRPSKLVVISTGLWGASWNVSFMQRRLQEAGGQSVLVYIATSNFALKSYSGIDGCGSRLSAEVRSLLDERDDLADVRKISFVGYSAGGLFVRYAIGALHEEGFFSERGITLDKVLTAAAPHLGIRSSPRGVMGRMKNRTLDTLGNLYGAATMDQIMLRDKRPGGNPLLLHMSLPGTRYSTALEAAGGVLFYANARRDNTVSYCTAAVARRNPYRGNKNVTFLEGFRYIAGVYRVSDDPDLLGEREARGVSVEKQKDGGPATAEASAPPLRSLPRGRQAPDAGEEETDLCADVSRDTSALRRSEPGPVAGVARAVAVPKREAGKPKVVNGGPRAAATVAALMPFLLMHLVAIAVPMRIAYAVFVGSVETDGNDRSFYDKVDGVGAETAEAKLGGTGERDLAEREQGRNYGCTPGIADKASGPSDEVTEPLIPTLEGNEPDPSVPCTDGTVDEDGPTDDAPNASNPPINGISQAGGRTLGTDGEDAAPGQVSTDGVESMPAAIRRNLGRPELGIKRVDVHLPDFHTHGSIVVRRSLVSNEGRVVVEHMATVLFE